MAASWKFLQNMFSFLLFLSPHIDLDMSRGPRCEPKCQSQRALSPWLLACGLCSGSLNELALEYKPGESYSCLFYLNFMSYSIVLV